MSLPQPGVIASFVRIKNFHSQKYVTARPQPDNGASLLEQDSDDGLNDQHWLWYQHDEDRSITLVNRASGLVADAMDGVINANADLQQYQDHAAPNQRWEFRRASDFPGTPGPLQDKWVIVPASTFTYGGANFVWDVRALSTDDGAPVQLFEWNHGENQLWEIERPQPVQGAFKIRCVEGGLALENYLFQWNFDMSKIPQNVATNQQSPVQTNPQGLGLNQVWILEDNGNGEVKVRSLTNNLVWAIPPDQVDQNAFPFLDRDDSSNLDHFWIFDDLTVQQQTFKIRSAATRSGRVLDMQNGSHDPGVFVQQFAPPHGGQNQQWWVEPFNF
jgi:hypothetical protein